ncbi:MAG: flagellar hook-associated protein FlgK [Pirellula sp.]|nr:flagellar hook-associated protein FlgK [Pirellula sp.]
MSLFSAVQSAATSLQINQLGLQVVGNNIANVNTPGYVRQQLIQSPAVGYRFGDTIIGQGVRAQAVQQVVDEFVLDRMRKTQSDLSLQEELESENVEVEALLNELTDRDFSSMLNRFADAFQEIANQPGSESMRLLALQRGQEIASELQKVSLNVQASAARARQSIIGVTSDINRLAKTIGNLNLRIVELEGGSVTRSDAVGLRDERIKALNELSSLVNINASEQPDGSVTVFIGGDFLLASNLVRELKTQVIENDDRGIEVRFVDSDSPVPITGGRLAGLYQTAMPSRPDGMQTRLDALARDMIRVVNSVHSQGQGSRGFRTTAGEVSIAERDKPLEVGNPKLDLRSGSFWISVTDERNSTERNIEIPIQQLGIESDTTPSQLLAAIDAVDGLSANWTNDGRLEIRSDSEAIRFSLSKDTSGVLAALGVNTFFRGTSALDIEVRPTLLNDPSAIAASFNGVGKGADNAIAIAEAFTKGHPLLDGSSIGDAYQRMYGDTIRSINEQKGIADGLRNFRQSLEAKHLSVSGVNLDEEAVKMIMYQRAFQATSRVITTAADLIRTLVEMV